MTAQQFNEIYPVGTIFKLPYPAPMRGIRMVKTVAPAQDGRSTTTVEINQYPHFVDIEKLIPPGL